MDGIDNLDELDERERQAAEDRAFEENPYGTGVDPDLDQSYNYDYEESPELTDTDYQPNTTSGVIDDSKYSDGKDFSVTGNNGEDDSSGNSDNTPEQENFDNDAEDFNDYDDEDEDDQGESENDDDEPDYSREGADEDGEEQDGQVGGDGQNQSGAKNNHKKQKEETEKQKARREKKEQRAAQKAEYQNLKIRWQKGDKIDMKLLAATWGQCAKIDKVRSLMQQANESVKQMLATSGSNLMLKLNEYISKLGDSASDTIGSLLALAQSTGKRLTFTFFSVIEAIFDQQWMQTVLIPTLPAIIEGLLAAQPLQGIMQLIFTIAVPIINGVAKKQAKGANK